MGLAAQPPPKADGVPGAQARRYRAAVAFADIVGYGVLLAADEQGTLRQWMDLLDGVIRPAVAGSGGRIVQIMGDGIVAEFDDAGAALAWAEEVHGAVGRSSTAIVPGAGRIVLRIAIDAGEVIRIGDNLFGQHVVIAARLQAHAEPGGVALPVAAATGLDPALRARLRPLGAIRLKNIDQAVETLALDPPIRPVLVPARVAGGLLPSIAVLPLRTLTRAADDRYFAAGVSEDVIVSLAALRELVVIARSSTLAYRGAEADPREVGARLGVRYVLSGTMQRSGTHIRVNVVLYEAETGRSLWAERLDAEGRELFTAQDAIVARIVSSIAPQVRAAELDRARRTPPESLTAYDHLLRGLDAMDRFDAGSFALARDHLDRAISEDPGFATPMAWAARWHCVQIGQNWSIDPNHDRTMAGMLAARAIALDPSNALALATFGHLRSFLFRDYDGALAHFDLALRAAPNSALAWLLSTPTLAYVGRGEQAIHHGEQAVLLSPHDTDQFTTAAYLGLAHYAAGDLEEAVRRCSAAMHARPHHTANLRVLAAALAGLGRQDEARKAADRILALEPGFSLSDFIATRTPFRDQAVRRMHADQLKAAGLPD